MDDLGLKSGQPVARPYALIVRSTERCEVGCTHCSINATPQGLDIDASLLEDVLASAREAGVGLIHFSGGEALLHPRLQSQIGLASDLGMYVELTTSTYTRPGESPADRLAGMKASGLQRVMLSYDEAHARRVPIAHYAAFVREAQRQDLEVCACVVEWVGTCWSLERVLDACRMEGCDVEAIDWCRIELSPVGRAARRTPGGVAMKPGGSARCPYVLTAPTLAPDGSVLLCPNVISSAPLFRIGDVRERKLKSILEAFLSSRFYRALAAHGPQALLADIEPDAGEDMCGACHRVLKAAEDPSVMARIAERAPDASEPVPLDVDALLPGHRRFVLGEARPMSGCLCG